MTERLAGRSQEMEMNVVHVAKSYRKFMRKKSIAAHVAFWIVTVSLASDGSVVKWAPEEYPYYDKKYYNKNNWIEKAGLAL
jgi:hypothetical protein